MLRVVLTAPKSFEFTFQPGKSKKKTSPDLRGSVWLITKYHAFTQFDSYSRHQVMSLDAIYVTQIVSMLAGRMKKTKRMNETVLYRCVTRRFKGTRFEEETQLLTGQFTALLLIFKLCNQFTQITSRLCAFHLHFYALHVWQSKAEPPLPRPRILITNAARP